jgi:hypothetical protein
MPFASARTDRTVFGNKRIVFGTYTSTSGSTGGVIASGLGQVTHVNLTSTTTSNTVRPTWTATSGGSVTIVTGANDVGVYEIIGTK